jgi:hypothetical protein
MRMTEQDLAAFMTRGHAAEGAVDKLLAPFRPKRKHPEDDLQRALTKYWALAHPYTWEYTFHPPNGMAARNPKLAAIFKGLGVKPGVFDLLCIARRGPYNGLALELKATRGRESAEQTEWRHRFEAQGWYATVAFSLESAIAVVEHYHGLPPRDTVLPYAAA